MGWKYVPLKDLCTNYKSDIVDGPFGSNLKREHFTADGVPVLKIQNIKVFKINDKKLTFVTPQKAQELKRHSYTEGDIIMTKLGDPLGVSAIVENGKEGIIVADLVRIRADKVDTKFLCYQLNSPQVQEAINSQQKGATRPRVKISMVRDLPINVPPIEEQKRIVAILDQAFEGIDKAIANTEKNTQNAKELFESYLNNVFTHKGEGWVEDTIENTCTLKSGSSLKKDLEKPKGELPYVKVADMSFEGNERSIISSSRFVNMSDVSSKTIFPTGAVIFPKRGGAIATNKKRITEVEICADLNIMAVWSNGSLTNEYLYYYFKSVDMAKLGSGTTIPQINNYDIAPLKISYPSSQAQQADLVASLVDIEANSTELIRINQQKLAALKELKQSLLQKAFAGELTSQPEELAEAV